MFREPLGEVPGVASVATCLAPGEPRGEVGQFDISDRAGYVLYVGTVGPTGCAHVNQAHRTPGQRLLAVGTGLDLGLVPSHSLPGQTTSLPSLGKTFVPGRDGLPTEVAADKDLTGVEAAAACAGESDVQLCPEAEHGPLVQEGPVAVQPGHHLVSVGRLY